MEKVKAAREGFDEAMDDDLNTADAMGKMFELVRDANVALDENSPKQAIAAVPEGMREVFLLRDVHGLSVEETAQALQIAQGTVKSRLARAREKIAAELKRRGVGQTGGERHAV